MIRQFLNSALTRRQAFELTYRRISGTETFSGDQYLCDASRTICDTFPHSPVYRIGGDEFAVISQGRDYEKIEELIGKIHNHNMDVKRNGGVIIACGMARLEDDPCVAAVFERADQNMYENKKELKAALCPG